MTSPMLVGNMDMGTEKSLVWSKQKMRGATDKIVICNAHATRSDAIFLPLHDDRTNGSMSSAEQNA
jgi:hypothetical protein